MTKALRMPEEVTFSAPTLLGRTGAPGTCALDTLGPASACAPVVVRGSPGVIREVVVLSPAHPVLDYRSGAAISATVGWRRVAWRGVGPLFWGTARW